MGSGASPAPQIRLVIFDFDGTLAETREAVSTTLNAALREHGLPRVHPPFIHHWMGMALETLVDRLIPPTRKPLDVGPIVRWYRAHFDEVGAPLVGAMPGAASVLSALRARGVQTAIATAREGTSLRGLLDRLALPPFDAIATCERVRRGKPAPDLVELVLTETGIPASEAVFVGDTTFDVDAGRAAGVRTVAVPHGSHDADRLRDAGPDAVLPDLPSLLPWLAL